MLWVITHCSFDALYARTSMSKGQLLLKSISHCVQNVELIKKTHLWANIMCSVFHIKNLQFQFIQLHFTFNARCLFWVTTRVASLLDLSKEVCHYYELLGDLIVTTIHYQGYIDATIFLQTSHLDRRMVSHVWHQLRKTAILFSIICTTDFKLHFKRQSKPLV